MAEDPVERAARIRKSLAKTVTEVRGGGAVDGPPDGETEAETARERHDGDVNALLKRTRAVIDRTRHVIEQTRASLHRLAGQDGDGDGDGDGGKTE